MQKKNFRIIKANFFDWLNFNEIEWSSFIRHSFSCPRLELKKKMKNCSVQNRSWNDSFLGVFLDDNLTWKRHISLLASKLSKSIGIIHKSRFFLSTQSLRTLYNSMILPYLYYCNLAWGGTYKANLQRIVILQKRALRIVNNSTYDANTSPIFKELKLLKFRDIHSFQLGFFMFSLKNSTLPSKFNNLFLINSQIHNYNTRNAHLFRLPLCRTNTRQFSIYFQGPKFYNSLNSTITGSSSSASFKRKLKEFLLSTY